MGVVGICRAFWHVKLYNTKIVQSFTYLSRVAVVHLNCVKQPIQKATQLLIAVLHHDDRFLLVSLLQILMSLCPRT